MAGLSKKYVLLLVVFTVVRVASAVATEPSPGVNNSRVDELNEEDDCCAAIRGIETTDETIRQVFWQHALSDGQCDLLLHEMHPKNDYVAILGVCNGTTLEKIQPFSEMDYTLLLANDVNAETIHFYNISTVGSDTEAFTSTRACSCPKSSIAGSDLELMLKSSHSGSGSNVDYVLVNVEQEQVLSYLPLRCTPLENLVFRVNLTSRIRFTACDIGKADTFLEIVRIYNGTVLKCKGSDEEVISPAKVRNVSYFQDLVVGNDFKGLDLYKDKTIAAENTDPDSGRKPVSYVDISIQMNVTARIRDCDNRKYLCGLSMLILRMIETLMTMLLVAGIVLLVLSAISEVCGPVAEVPRRR